jgi:hypothetical protein
MMIKSTPVLEVANWSPLLFGQDNNDIDKAGERVSGKITDM